MAINYRHCETCELGTPKGLWKTVLNSEVVLFLRSISMYWIGLGTHVAVLNSQVVPISQVVLKTGFAVNDFISVWLDSGRVGSGCGEGPGVYNSTERHDRQDCVLRHLPRQPDNSPRPHSANCQWHTLWFPDCHCLRCLRAVRGLLDWRDRELF